MVRDGKQPDQSVHVTGCGASDNDGRHAAVWNRRKPLRDALRPGESAARCRNDT